MSVLFANTFQSVFTCAYNDIMLRIFPPQRNLSYFVCYYQHVFWAVSLKQIFRQVKEVVLLFLPLHISKM